MKAVHFDFHKTWLTTVKAVREHPAVRKGLERVENEWILIAECKREGVSAGHLEQAEKEFDLDLHTLEVKRWDLHWLREWSRGCSNILCPLAFGIATALYPQKQWEYLEHDDFMVVVDRERTLVFDFENFDRMTAGASLMLAGETSYEFDPRDLEDFCLYQQRRIDESERILKLITARLKEADRDHLRVVT